LEERSIEQNAEFMVGDILIRLVYPESKPGVENTENWTDQELRDANHGAVAGALAFQEKFNYLPMNFVFTVEERVECDYEAIRHSLSDDADTWIPDVMTTMGFGGLKNAALMVHGYNNDGRKRFGTDWVYTAFIANSRNEPGHIFSGHLGGAGYTAYANIGGPYLVIPFPAGATNPNNLSEVLLFSQIFQHEMVHIFYGLDEYIGAMSDCKSHAGYLNYINKNKLSVSPDGETVGCPGYDYVNCLMWNARAAEEDGRPICFFTAGQTGVVDANRNGIPDVFDRAPTVVFETAAVETVETPEITVRMTAHSLAVPNLNPFQTEPRDYAAPLKDATISIDGVGATRLDPDDGKWNEVEEDLTLVLDGLPSGLTQIEVKVRNAFGATSQKIVKKIYFIGLSFALFHVNVKRERIDVGWRTVGETFGAQIDLYRIENVSGKPDTLRVVADIQPENPGELFQRFL
jgi:hypothetical protein